MKIIKEITEDKPYLVLYKPSGLPSAPLSPDDKNNAFSKAAELYPCLLDVKGKKEIEHGLIHRLDTETSGLLIIAANQEYYEKLLQLQKEGKIIKTYTAFCNVDLENAEKLGSFPPCENPFRPEEKFYCQQSFFRPYGDGRKEVRPVTEASSKIIQKKVGKSVIYRTNIECQAIENNQIKVKARISNGFRHQVRCHLAWMGLPVAGDKLYNYKNKEEDMKFFATQIELSGDIWYI